MVLTIDEFDLDVDQRVAGARAVGQRFLDALLDGGDELARDRTALDGVDEVKALATMPAKEELYAKLLFLINSPAQRLVTVLNATGRDLAVVVNEAVKGEKFAGAAAPAAKAEAPVAEVAPEPAKAEAVAEPVATPEPVAVAEPEKQAEAAATEAPVEGAVVEEAAPAEVAPVAAEAVVEPVAVGEPEKQAEAAATEEPVEGAPVAEEPKAE